MGTNGGIKMANYLTTHKIGEYVDVLVDSAIHKGLPHYFYHGKTGRISRCRTAFNDRIKENDKLKHEAKQRGERISTKRTVAGPLGEKTLKMNRDALVLRSHKPYIELY